MNNTDGAVKVRSMKETRGGGTMSLELEQQVLRPLNNSGALLTIFMQGHPSFGSPYQTRVAYQNISTTQVEALGLFPGSSFPAEWNARLVAHEFCDGDTIPESLRLSFPTVYKSATYKPRTWTTVQDDMPKDMWEQPKKTVKVENQEQTVLCRGDQPIYRNVFLSIGGMDQNDYLIKHTNLVPGSTNQILNVENSFKAELPQ